MVENIFTIPDAHREMEIGSSPLWFSLIDAYATKDNNRSLKFVASRSMKRNLTLIDKNNKAFVSLAFDDNCVIVNNRYELFRMDG